MRRRGVLPIIYMALIHVYFIWGLFPHSLSSHFNHVHARLNTIKSILSKKADPSGRYESKWAVWIKESRSSNPHVARKHIAFLLLLFKLCCIVALKMLCSIFLRWPWALHWNIWTTQAKGHAFQIQMWGKISRQHSRRTQYWKQQDIPFYTGKKYYFSP